MVLLRSTEGWNETGSTGLNIPPRPAAVCSSRPGTPALTLRCGLEFSQEHSEERLDERDWVYSANHRATVCLLPCLHAVSHTTYTAAGVRVCLCVCALYVWGFTTSLYHFKEDNEVSANYRKLVLFTCINQHCEED